MSHSNGFFNNTPVIRAVVKRCTLGHNLSSCPSVHINSVSSGYVCIDEDWAVDSDV